MTPEQEKRYQDRIRELEDEGARRAAFAVEAAQRYAEDREAWTRDLTATRGAILRLRFSILEGASDAEQGWALESSAAVIAEPGSATHAPATFRICAAFLALHEGHKATKARLAKIADMARVIGMGPAL